MQIYLRHFERFEPNRDFPYFRVFSKFFQNCQLSMSGLSSIFKKYFLIRKSMKDSSVRYTIWATAIHNLTFCRSVPRVMIWYLSHKSSLPNSSWHHMITTYIYNQTYLDLYHWLVAWMRIELMTFPL